MSFITALLGGFGAYGQGKAQGAEFALQQQQAQEQLKEQQQELALRKTEAQQQEQQFQLESKQEYANQGYDMNAPGVKFNTDTGQWEGMGQPYAYMPKGWPVVPSKPEDQVGHWGRVASEALMHGDTDLANYATGQQNAASAAVAAASALQEKYWQPQYERGTQWGTAYIHGQSQLNNTVYEQAHEDAREAGRESNQVFLHNLDADRALKLKLIGDVPTLMALSNKNGGFLYGDSKAIQTRLGQAQQSMNTTLNQMGQENASGTSKLYGDFNPHLGDWFTPQLQIAVDIVTKDPSKAQAAIAKAQAWNTLYKTKGDTSDPSKPMSSTNNPGFSDNELRVFTQYVEEFARYGKALQMNAQQESSFLQQYGMTNPLGGTGGFAPLSGGSYGNQNPTVSRLSQADIWDLARQQGATPQEATILAAIAYAESGGRPDAVNPTDNHGTQTSWGLFQISDGTHNEPANWDDPVTNMQMALAKMRGAEEHGRNPFSPWGTYDSRAYLQYLPRTG